MTDDMLKKKALSRLGASARCVGTKEVNGWTLSLWENNNLPRTKAAYLVRGKRILSRTKSLDGFSTLLRAVRPKIRDVSVFGELMRNFCPENRVILTDQKYVPAMQDGVEVWRSPAIEGARAVFYCNNFFTGNVEKLEVSEDYSLKLTVVGKGQKMLLR